MVFAVLFVGVMSAVERLGDIALYLKPVDFGGH